LSFKSGFSLAGEGKLFENWIFSTPFTINGFSYGAILAFEEVLNSDNRIDTLQLFSPAFFQTQKASYKKMQLRYYKADPEAYEKAFLENVAYPSSYDLKPYYKKSTPKVLETLLNYEWSGEKLQLLRDRGVKIEVYLGEVDKIIDAKACKEFFEPFAKVFYFKQCGHLLKGEKVESEN
jgi:hypothetical protein